MTCLIFMSSWKGPCTSANIKTRIKSKNSDELELAKEKRRYFYFILSEENTLSDQNFYIFTYKKHLDFKTVESLQCIPNDNNI